MRDVIHGSRRIVLCFYGSQAFDMVFVCMSHQLLYKCYTNLITVTAIHCVHIDVINSIVKKDGEGCKMELIWKDVIAMDGLAHNREKFKVESLQTSQLPFVLFKLCELVQCDIDNKTYIYPHQVTVHGDIHIMPSGTLWSKQALSHQLAGDKLQMLVTPQFAKSIKFSSTKRKPPYKYLH
uniref:Uncharacterized protein n=1 Tax=Glossina palpalis gambiensis TaxID=67801 RepID=A0A1B0ATZ4_9MUSC